MSSESGDGFDGGNTLLLGLVREHGSIDAVSNGVDVGDGGAEVGVNFDAAELVGLDAELVKAKALRR